jgi:hypothetical protein
MLDQWPNDAPEPAKLCLCCDFKVIGYYGPVGLEHCWIRHRRVTPRLFWEVMLQSAHEQPEPLRAYWVEKVTAWRDRKCS